MERIGSIYKANFDYESVLFEGKKEPKVNEIFEHLFFLCCDKEDYLLTNKTYSPEYLDYLKSATGFKNKICKEGKVDNWWGKLDNLEIERELNSKRTSLQVSKLLNTNASQGYEVLNLNEIKDHLIGIEEVIIRSPFERSGRNNIIIKGIEELEKFSNQIEGLLKKSPLLLEEYHRSRNLDLGTTFIEKEDGFEIDFQVKNLNDANGVFRGGILIKEMVGSPYLDKISAEYYRRGAREYLQVDSFKFGENWNWLCEVNFRKTMGFVIKKLSRLCPPSYETALLATPSSWLNKINQYDLLEEVDGVFLLSPLDSPIKFWLASAENIAEMNLQLQSWWGHVGAEGREFPKVFKKIIED